jgi:hypothetical protein
MSKQYATQGIELQKSAWRFKVGLFLRELATLGEVIAKGSFWRMNFSAEQL